LCSRCGADLEPLMMLAAQAWILRDAARILIGVGQSERALELAAQAQEAQWTPAGEALWLVSGLLSGS
jgi:hypothetical protein